MAEVPPGEYVSHIGEIGTARGKVVGVDEVNLQVTPAKRFGLMGCVLLGLLLVSGCTWFVPPYRHDLEAARQRIDSGSRLADTRCGPIEYAVAGEGPPLLVVHGAGGGFDQGLMIGAPLAKAGYQVIAVSRFGYLRTPLPQDASPAAQADAYACLLDALGIRRAAILGASAGAPSTLQFALRHPERCEAVVLLVPVVFDPRSGGAPAPTRPPGMSILLDTVMRSDFLIWLQQQVSPSIVEKMVMGTPPSVVAHASPEEQARVAKMMQQLLPLEPRRDGLLNDMQIIEGMQRYDLEKIAVPTLVISTADDRYGTYAAGLYTSVHIPKARFIGYTQGGHMMVGDQEDARDAIAAFLQGGASSMATATAAQSP